MDQAPARPFFSRGTDPADDVWRASKRITGALVTGLFPFLFILDESMRFSFSPVLPGLITLAALILMLPFAINEGAARALRNRDPSRRALHADRMVRTGKILSYVAVFWLLLWLGLGA